MENSKSFRVIFYINHLKIIIIIKINRLVTIQTWILSNPSDNLTPLYKYHASTSDSSAEAVEKGCLKQWEDDFTSTRSSNKLPCPHSTSNSPAQKRSSTFRHSKAVAVLTSSETRYFGRSRGCGIEGCPQSHRSAYFIARYMSSAHLPTYRTVNRYPIVCHHLSHDPHLRPLRGPRLPK